STELARFLDVAVHLSDQLLDARKAPLAAQPLDEGDPKLATVEVALVVDQIGLDQLTAAALEGRADADVDGRGMTVGEGRIDTVAGADQAIVGNKVCGGEAELAAALVADNHLTLDHHRSPEAAACCGDLAGRDQRPDP